MRQTHASPRLSYAPRCKYNAGCCSPDRGEGRPPKAVEGEDAMRKLRKAEQNPPKSSPGREGGPQGRRGATLSAKTPSTQWEKCEKLNENPYSTHRPRAIPCAHSKVVRSPNRTAASAAAAALGLA